jgi:arylsulfatase A-like enzyme
MDGSRLNVVYIVTDQHRWDMLGCYGHPLVKTPAIDRLAHEGVRFTHAFTPTAICGPARASLFTGLVPTQHGIVGNSESAAGGGVATLRPDTGTMVDFTPGYDHVLCGKWHADDGRLPRDCGFRGHNFAGYGFPGSGVYEGLAFDQGPGEENRYRDWLAEKGAAPQVVTEGFCGNNPRLQCQELRGRLSGPAEHSIPHFLADEACRQIDEARDPFLLWMNFWGPHTPCVIPEPYYSMYDPASIAEDPAFADDLSGKPIHHRYIAEMWGVYDLNWPEWQEIIARYFGYITMIDDCVGKVLDHLEARGLMEQSLIVFTADHGDAMGAHRLIEKGEFMYDETYRIPLIARHPQCQQPGTVNDEFVYLHDLCPTAADVAGQAAPDLGQAKSVLPLMRGDAGAASGRDYAYGQFTRHFMSLDQRMLRTRTHKLVYNAPAVGELYDLVRDPHELENRIDDPAYAAVKAQLLDLLEQEMRQLNDPKLGWFSRIRDVY